MEAAAILTDIGIRLAGAICGAVLALVLIPPKSKWGFVRRLLASLICGVLFASFIQDWAAFKTGANGTMAAACLASFIAWPSMGKLVHLIRDWTSR